MGGGASLRAGELRPDEVVLANRWVSPMFMVAGFSVMFMAGSNGRMSCAFLFRVEKSPRIKKVTGVMCTVGGCFVIVCVLA